MPYNFDRLLPPWITLSINIDLAWKQGFHLDPSIYLLNKESGGFGSGAVQMKALPSAANTVAVAGIEKDGKAESSTHSGT